jgi:hypothetical protein
MEVNDMSMANELYKAMADYCVKNKWWCSYTAKDWNEVLGTNYASATFTALVNSGRVERDKGYRGKVYTYQVIPFGEHKEEMKRQEEKERKEWAERVIANYDNRIAEIEAEFEEEFKELEERKKERIGWANLALKNAKEIIEG